MEAEEVRRLALAGRIAPDPAYHAHQHGLRFADVAAALAHCFRIEEDPRLDEDGHRLHPDGFLAWCAFTRGRVLRVDLNIQDREDGRLLLPVTAFEVG